MKEKQISLLESFIETIESSRINRERWFKKVGQNGLEQTLGEYNESIQINPIEVSYDHKPRMQ